MSALSPLPQPENGEVEPDRWAWWRLAALGGPPSCSAVLAPARVLVEYIFNYRGAYLCSREGARGGKGWWWGTKARGVPVFDPVWFFLRLSNSPAARPATTRLTFTSATHHCVVNKKRCPVLWLEWVMSVKAGWNRAKAVAFLCPGGGFLCQPLVVSSGQPCPKLPCTPWVGALQSKRIVPMFL